MFRAAFAVLFLAGPALAEEPLRFKFQTGQVLTYAVQQTTTVSETTADEKTSAPVTATTATQLSLTRRWEVKAVDAAGIATLEMSITAMKQQIARPGPADKDGKPTVDRLVIDTATPEGLKQTAEYLNKPIVTVKLDARGRLLEANAVGGAASRLDAELPFRVTLPEAAVAANAAWDRTFTMKLEPPLGTGEKYDATQSYGLKRVDDGTAVIGVRTALKMAPTDPAQMPPLVPLLWEGEVYFQTMTGRYAGAKLSVKKVVPNHQGGGTKFVYESQYIESLEK